MFIIFNVFKNRLSNVPKGALLFVCLLALIFSLSGCESDRALSVSLNEIPISSSDNSLYTNSYESEASRVVYVYVCGAVVTPKVVELPEGSRVEKALELAGGYAWNARTDVVNLAATVKDGEKIYFPTVDENMPADGDKAGLVNINTDTLERLMSLPGIGESKAKDIINYREKNGRFSQIEDIMNVVGIKEAAFEKVKDYICVD